MPAGDYFIASSLTLKQSRPLRGAAGDARRGALVVEPRNFDLKGYSEAFGDDVIGLKKGIQQLFNQSDHEAFDLCGRARDPRGADRRAGGRGQSKTPMPTGACCETASCRQRPRPRGPTRCTRAPAPGPRPIRGGSRACRTWPTSRWARWSRHARRRARDLRDRQGRGGGGRVTLSGALYGAPVTQGYTFTRFQYLLDFIGWQTCSASSSRISSFSAQDALFRPQHAARRAGGSRSRTVFFTGPKDRGITSAGERLPGDADRPLPVPLERTTDGRAAAHHDRLQLQLFRHKGARQTAR